MLLGLLDGQVTEGPDCGTRVDYEYHATTWEHRITWVSEAFSGLCLNLERHDEAVAQMRRRPQAIPMSGGIVEGLMLTHLAIGDRGASEALYRCPLPSARKRGEFQRHVAGAPGP